MHTYSRFPIQLMTQLLLAVITFTTNAQLKNIRLTNATIHIGNGKVIPNGTLTFRNGKIIHVGNTADSSADATIINLQGQHVYPGLIAPATSLGLLEIEVIRPTVDNREIGELNPSISTLSSYNTGSGLIGPLRSAGVLLAQIVPQGELLAGSSSIVQLDAWNWEDAAYATDNGMHLYIPPPNPYAPDPAAAIIEKINGLKTFFSNARAYLQVKQPQAVHLKYEALRPLFNKQQKLYVHCNLVKEMLAAIDLSQQFDLPLVIVGGAEAWRITGVLKAANVPVILASTYSVPLLDDDRIEQPIKTAAQLQQAGVLYCFGPVSHYWLQRNFLFGAGRACAHGLEKEQALAALTLNTAKILGIDSQTGSLEPGKDANIVVSKGDILDITTSQVNKAFIQGREINLDDEQKQLYRKYKEKYGLK